MKSWEMRVQADKMDNSRDKNKSHKDSNDDADDDDSDDDDDDEDEVTLQPRRKFPFRRRNQKLRSTPRLPSVSHVTRFLQTENDKSENMYGGRMTTRSQVQHTLHEKLEPRKKRATKKQQQQQQQKQQQQQQQQQQLRGQHRRQ